MLKKKKKEKKSNYMLKCPKYGALPLFGTGK